MSETIIPTAHLFPILDHELIQLLQTLTDEEWNRPTIAKLWTVKDVAAHLLDGNVRGISMLRDKHFGNSPGDISTSEKLIGFLNNLNADWVNAMKRMSPKLLTELLALTGPAYCDQMAALSPFEQAIFSVGWAGDETSPNWFHVAREYTEKWHHQQQIRDAVNKPGNLSTRELYHPVLDTFMMALPHTYRNTDAPKNTVVQVSISGKSGGDWFLTKKEKWELSKTDSHPVTARTNIVGSVAWKLFTKSWRRKEILSFVSIEGNRELGEVVLDMVSVMA